MPYKEHPSFESPDPATVLWRYVDFARFMSVVDRSALYFPAASRLSDSFEGSMTRSTYAVLREELSQIPAEEADKFIADMGRTAKQMREHVYISCWHASPIESAAMWALYAGLDRGIAIRTTFDRFTASLQSSDAEIHTGRVRYVDFDEEAIPIGNLFNPFLYKRKSFAHEQEVRAMVLQLPIVDQMLDWNKPVPSGLEVQVDLGTLVEEVYLAPQTPLWIFDLVQSILSKYGLDVVPRESALAAQPLY